ncbi:MAG: T9SS type A sorting domain-containing protein, partial [Bacteroidia bacterium]
FDPGVGSYTLTPSGSGDVFICNLDASGNFMWAKSVGGTSGDEAYGIALDNAGGVYVTGDFSSTSADFDPGAGTYNLSAVSGGLDIYILKLNASGNFKWAKSISGPGAETAYSVEYDGFNGIYTTGNFSSNTDFDPNAGTFNLSPVGFYDIFISKLDTAGNFIWAGGMGSTFPETANDLAVDAYGNVFTVGGFKSTVDFDFTASTYTLSSVGDYDAFIHKINNCFAPSVAVNTTPASNQTICTGNTTTLSASSTGTISWYTAITPTISGVGPTFVTSTLTAGTYTFYAQAQNCTFTSAIVPIVITVQLCTGVNEIKNEMSGIFIYPNPTKDNIKLVLPFEGEKEILVFDMKGILVKKIITKEKNEQISLANCSEGMYILKINSVFGSYNYKIVKE